MYVVAYYKFGNQWFLDYPEYLEQGAAEDLERVGKFHEFLEFVARGRTNISFEMDTQFMPGADVMKLKGSSGALTGGYYQIQEIEGKPVDFEIWMNAVIYHQQTILPENIYFKQVTPV